MIFEALLASLVVTLTSLVGVFFFADSKKLIGVQKFIIPVAVGVFLSLVLYGLVPETLEASPDWGASTIAFGFISFYLLANFLHKKFHNHSGEENCDKKSTAILILIGDGIHNIADGFILGSAYLIDPSIGLVTALGLAFHEIPQEIAEFGVLLQAGYSKKKAALLNFVSASGIILGTIFIFVVAEYASDYIWILTGISAGSLLFLAASDLLPRIHGNLKQYESIWHSTISIVLGFLIMSAVLVWTHSYFGHGHHEEEVGEEHHLKE